MKITFYGAVREVTGSCHLISTGNDKILLDCGMFQGRRKDTNQKNREFLFNPEIITNMVLSHAHIDHSGRIPLLVKSGFNGRIICTRATTDACAYLLPDSAHIQESDAQYLNYKLVRSTLYKIKNNDTGNTKKDKIKKLLKKNNHRLNSEVINDLIKKHNLEGIIPLYTIADAEQALTNFEGHPYRVPIIIGNQMTCTLYEAGHILGSAISIIKTKINGKNKTICYTGDLGRFDKPILKDPTLNFADDDRKVDLLIMESTYGDRLHEPVKDLKPRLKKVLQETYKRNGTVIIPSFAYGRTQEILYVLHELFIEGSVKKVPVYVDSPLATNITRVFGEHPEVYDKETHETFLKNGLNPFYFKEVNFTSSVEESMALMRKTEPHVVISASGMCEAGRILHHLRYKVHNPNNTVLIVGFMAQHTLGRRLLELGQAYESSGRKGEAPLLKFLNKTYPLRARVVKIDGFSAHADKNEMLRFLNKSNLQVKQIAVVHGEDIQAKAFAGHLHNNGYQAWVPRKEETVQI